MEAVLTIVELADKLCAVIKDVQGNQKQCRIIQQRVERLASKVTAMPDADVKKVHLTPCLPTVLRPARMRPAKVFWWPCA